MTATDELRRLLDERGVKHEGSERSVRWRDRNGVIMQAFPLASGELGIEVWSCTPEQAIAATLGNEGVARSNDGVAELGAGTCHETMIDRFFRGCSECGYMWEYMYGIGRCQRPNYCPNCGRKVVDDG